MNNPPTSHSGLPLNWRQILPNLITIAAMIAGFLSILVTIHALQHGMPHLFRLAAQLIMLSMILDGLDGNLARYLKGSSEFGGELDTYVDLMSFGISPAILLFAVTLQTQAPSVRAILPCAVALSGMLRLARFKVLDPLRGQGGYSGLPITANAGWVSMFVFIHQTPPAGRFSFEQGWVSVLFLFGVILLTIMQLTTVRYPKPSKKMALFIPCIVLVGFLFFPGESFSVTIAGVILALGIMYVVGGPFIKGKKTPPVETA